jgi:putative acyl-CoA dehydrogenase
VARTLCASLLVRSAPTSVSDAYCETRLGPRLSGAFGELPSKVEAASIVERALPESH